MSLPRSIPTFDGKALDNFADWNNSSMMVILGLARIVMANITNGFKRLIHADFC